MAKPRRSLPKGQTVTRQTGKAEMYAYEIKDASFGVLRVLSTANGWWQDRAKLEKLIDAFKIDATDERACFYAGILPSALKYFIKLHPEFSQIKEHLKENLGMAAQQVLANEVQKNAAAANAYLTRKEANKKQIEDRRRRERAEQEGEPANAVVFVDFEDPANALPAGKENDDHAESE